MRKNPLMAMPGYYTAGMAETVMNGAAAPNYPGGYTNYYDDRPPPYMLPGTSAAAGDSAAVDAAYDARRVLAEQERANQIALAAAASHQQQQHLQYQYQQQPLQLIALAQAPPAPAGLQAAAPAVAYYAPGYYPGLPQAPQPGPSGMQPPAITNGGGLVDYPSGSGVNGGATGGRGKKPTKGGGGGSQLQPSTSGEGADQRRVLHASYRRHPPPPNGVPRTRNPLLPAPSLRGKSRGGPSGVGKNSGGVSKKVKGNKRCGVCGDEAKSFHFGGLSCDSCKAFFRRSVQNGGFKNFFCSFEKNCDIAMVSRKTCQFCRFRKCLEIGMEKNWVMTGEEREKLLRTRMEKKRKMFEMEQSNPGGAGSHYCLDAYEPDEADKPKHMSADDQHDIERLVNAYRESYEEMPYNLDDTSDDSDGDLRRANCRVLNMFSTIVKRMFLYAKRLPGFADIEKDDQSILLRGGVLEMCLLRGAMVFDTNNNRWPNTTLTMYRNCPTLRVENMRPLVSAKLFDLHMSFIQGVQALKPDESTIMLLSAIVLICPDRRGLSNPDAVNKLQERYLHLAKKYMTWRYGPRNARATYPKLLMLLVDLQCLNDNRNEGHILLTQKEIMEIQKNLGNLSIQVETFKTDANGVSGLIGLNGGNLLPLASQITAAEELPVSPLTEVGSVNATGLSTSLQRYLMGEADSITNFLLNNLDNDDDDDEDAEYPGDDNQAAHQAFPIPLVRAGQPGASGIGLDGNDAAAIPLVGTRKNRSLGNGGSARGSNGQMQAGVDSQPGPSGYRPEPPARASSTSSGVSTCSAVSHVSAAPVANPGQANGASKIPPPHVLLTQARQLKTLVDTLAAITNNQEVSNTVSQHVDANALTSLLVNLQSNRKAAPNDEQNAAANHQQVEAGNVQQEEAANFQQEDAANFQQQEALNLQQQEALNLQQDEALNLQQQEALNLQQDEALNLQQDEALNLQQNGAFYLLQNAPANYQQNFAHVHHQMAANNQHLPAENQYVADNGQPDSPEDEDAPNHAQEDPTN